MNTCGYLLMLGSLLAGGGIGYFIGVIAAIIIAVSAIFGTKMYYTKKGDSERIGGMFLFPILISLVVGLVGGGILSMFIQ